MNFVDVNKKLNSLLNRSVHCYHTAKDAKSTDCPVKYA